MGLKQTNEFRKDAVRIALTSGLTRKQVADDLGVGMSKLNKWITAHRPARPPLKTRITNLLSGPSDMVCLRQE